MAKILCFIDELGSGGAERQLVGLASLLQKAGHEVEVYCYHPIYFYEPFLKKEGVKLLKESSSPKRLITKFKRSYNVITKGKYNVVIAYAPGAVMASLVTKLINCHFKLIVSDRNTTPEITFRDLIKYNLYRVADYIVPNSHAQAKILRAKFPFMRKKIHTITNCVDINKFRPALSNIATCNPLLKIIVVARHFPVKNGINFLKALQIIKEHHINIAVKWFGNINTSYFKTIENLGIELHVNDIITFLPHQDNIENFYLDADVFCLPSLIEGFSNAIGEAMSCGLPILCSDNVGDNNVMVEDGINGILFDPYSPSDIADAIIRFYHLTQEKKVAMGQRSRQKAEELLTADKFINQYLNLINNHDC